MLKTQRDQGEPFYGLTRHTGLGGGTAAGQPSSPVMTRHYLVCSVVEMAFTPAGSWSDLHTKERSEQKSQAPLRPAVPTYNSPSSL